MTPKRFLTLLWIVVTVGLFTACSDDDNSPDLPPSQVEKTLLVYMPWTANESTDSGSLYEELLQNITDMEAGIVAQGGLGNTRLLLFVSRNAHDSHFIEVKYRQGKCYRDTLQQYSGNKYVSATGLAALLGKAKAVAPAAHYALLVGCHGSGWIPKDADNYFGTRSFGGNSPNYRMETSELAEAIRLANMYMQYICFDDCYMAGIEVAYDLKDVTDHIIASTSEIQNKGLPYRDIWKQLSAASPNYAAIVASFYKYYAQSYGTLSVINCQEVDATAALMSHINTLFTFNNAQLPLLQKLDGMGQTIFFDFGSYGQYLCDDSEYGTLLREQLTKLVPYHTHTSSIFTDLWRVNGGFSTIPVNTFSGITISDPTTNTYLINRKYLTAWWKATH